MCDSNSYSLSRELEKQKRICQENECEKKKLLRIIEMLGRDLQMQQNNLERDKRRLHKAKQVYVNLCNAKTKLHKALLHKEQQKQDLEEEVKHIHCRINLMNTRIEMENINIQKLAMEICSEDQYEDFYADDVLLNLESTGGDLCLTVNDLHCIVKKVNSFYWRLKYLSMQMTGDCIEDLPEDDPNEETVRVCNKSCQSSVELYSKCLQTKSPKKSSSDDCTQTKALVPKDFCAQTDVCSKSSIDTQTISSNRKTVSTACGPDHVVIRKQDSSTNTTDSWPVTRCSSMESDFDFQPAVTSSPNPKARLSPHATTCIKRKKRSPRKTQDNIPQQFEDSFPERDNVWQRVQPNNNNNNSTKVPSPNTVGGTQFASRQAPPVAVCGSTPYVGQLSPPNPTSGINCSSQLTPNVTISSTTYQVQPSQSQFQMAQPSPPMRDYFGDLVKSCTGTKEQHPYQNSPGTETPMQQLQQNNQMQHSSTINDRPQQARDEFLICSSNRTNLGTQQQSIPLKTLPSQCFPTTNERPAHQFPDSFAIADRTNYFAQEGSPNRDQSANPMVSYPSRCDDKTVYQIPPVNDRSIHSPQKPSMDRMRTAPTDPNNPACKVMRLPQVIEENSPLQQQYPVNMDQSFRQTPQYGPIIDQSAFTQYEERLGNQVRQCFPDREYPSHQTPNYSQNRDLSDYQMQQYAPLTNYSNYARPPNTPDKDRGAYTSQQYQPTNIQPDYPNEFKTPKSVRQPGQSITESPSASCFQSDILPTTANSAPRYPLLPQSSMLLCSKEFESTNKNSYNNNSGRCKWDDGNSDHLCNTSTASFREVRRFGDTNLEQMAAQTKAWTRTHPNISTVTPRSCDEEITPTRDIRAKTTPTQQRDTRYPNPTPAQKTKTPQNGAKFKGRLNIKSEDGELFNGMDKVSGTIKFGDQASDVSGLQESTTQDSSDSDVDNRNCPVVFMSPSKHKLRRASHSRSPRKSSCKK